MFFSNDRPTKYKTFLPKICEMCGIYFLRLASVVEWDDEFQQYVPMVPFLNTVDADASERICPACKKDPERASQNVMRRKNLGYEISHTYQGSTNWSSMGVRG